MKKNLWIWALAAFSMAACTSEDVPTQEEQVVTENDWESPDGRVVVQLSAEGLPTPTASVSRSENGTGIIEGEDIIELNDLGIIALANNLKENEQYNKDTETVLLNNVRAKGRGTTTLDKDVHTTLDQDGNEILDDNGNKIPLKRISLYSNSTEQAGDKASIYYYPLQPNYNYNFYGYFPRQENVNYGENAEVTFEPTEGNMDIITGAAGVATTMGKDMLYVDESAAMNSEPLNGYNSKYIRSIKYHNWLIDEHANDADNKFKVTTQIKKQRFVPNIKFRHRTALLEFYIVANEKQAGKPENGTEGDDSDEPYIDQYNTKKLRVFDLKLLDVNTVAKWNVNSDVITWDENEKADLEIQKVSTEGTSGVWDNTEYTYKINEEEETVNLSMIPAENKNSAKQAGYLMVQPDRDDYQIGLSILAPKDANNPYPPTQYVILNLGFTPAEGNKYKIYIKLNAMQEVNIHAELQGWIYDEENGTNDFDIPVE